MLGSIVSRLASPTFDQNLKGLKMAWNIQKWLKKQKWKKIVEVKKKLDWKICWVIFFLIFLPKQKLLKIVRAARRDANVNKNPENTFWGVM